MAAITKHEGESAACEGECSLSTVSCDDGETPVRLVLGFCLRVRLGLGFGLRLGLVLVLVLGLALRLVLRLGLGSGSTCGGSGISQPSVHSVM